MLEVFTLEKSEKWDLIVKTFLNYDVYYLTGYVKAFNIHGDGEPLLFYYSDDKCRGINVVMKRDIALDLNFKGKIKINTYFDLSTPYGYGGWLIEGECSDNLFVSYEKWCIDNNIVSEFVRFHPVINNCSFSDGFYEIIPLGETVSVDISNKDKIWENFTAKNRNVIRKAINNNVVINKSNSLEIYKEFKDIYNKTMDKDKASSYYYFEDKFYESIMNDLRDNAIVFYASLDDKIIAASIIIYANDKVNYHLSGSLREYQNLAPSNLLLWKVAEWGNVKGFKSFHLGGGVGSHNDSLLHFKKAFYRGDLCRYFIGKKVFDKYKYDKLVSMRKEIINEDFFPKYRG